jgi:hypothetical protein
LIQILSIKGFDAAVPPLPAETACRINLISEAPNTLTEAEGRRRRLEKPVASEPSCLPGVNAFFAAFQKRRGSAARGISMRRRRKNRKVRRPGRRISPNRSDRSEADLPDVPRHLRSVNRAGGLRAKALAQTLLDQQVRDVDIGRTPIGMVHRGKLGKPAQKGE